MSKSKKLKFISLVTVFCLTVAYFSVLSPTTAYFVETDTKQVNVTFYNISSQQTVSDTAVNFNLKAATKFADFNEIRFDDVLYSQFVRVQNNGDAPAVIYLNVNIPAGSAANGLRCFVSQTLKASNNGSTYFILPNGSDNNKGDIKEFIESQLHQFNSDFDVGVTQQRAEQILENYNAKVKTFATAPLLDVGEAVGFQIFFWAEYGDIEGTINDTSEIASYDYSANVVVSARQNTAGAQ